MTRESEPVSDSTLRYVFLVSGGDGVKSSHSRLAWRHSNEFGWARADS